MDADRGVVSAMVAVLTVVFVACSGLVLDGGRLVAARSQAAARAHEAARAGSQELHRLRSGSLDLDAAGAVARARAYLEGVGATGEVRADERRVTVTVRSVVQPLLLGVLGVGARTVDATRSASPFDS
ncbi:MAG: hypothetical protein RL219_1128 [Actinomycetota bacterium]|jgi:Flp pilus assembly protein TadG